MVRIWTGAIVGEGERVHHPAIAGGRIARPAVGPTTRTGQGPRGLRGHLILVKVLKPWKLCHPTERARGIVRRPAGNRTGRTAIPNVKIVARRRLQTCRSKGWRRHPGRTRSIAQRKPQRPIFNLVVRPTGRIANRDTGRCPRGQRYVRRRVTGQQGLHLPQDERGKQCGKKA